MNFFRGTHAVCLNLNNSQAVACGQKVIRTRQKVTVPVGPETLGRVFSATGEPLDKAPPITTNLRPITVPAGTKSYRTSKKLEFLETGLKVIDFLTPFVKGRKIGVIGGAGVGKTVLTMEMIHNVTMARKDEDGSKRSKVIPSRSIVVSVSVSVKVTSCTKRSVILTCSKTPSCSLARWTRHLQFARWLALPPRHAAEYFRDEEGKDILFFVDNIYRHVQAMTEMSTNLGLIPSEGGYSPMVFSDLRRLQDRLSSTAEGTITSVQAIYVPADDLSDPAVQAISQQLDSVLVLDRSIAETGIRPAVNLLKTTSSLLTPTIVGERHYRLAERVQQIMQKYDSLKNIIAIVGENELSPADRADYQNAKKLIQFFSQDFAVAEKFTGKPGEYYTLEETLSGIEEIIASGDGSSRRK